MKSNEQVRKEIETLKELAPKIRQYSSFGDDNRAAVEAQIKVLENPSWDEDEIFRRFEGDFQIEAEAQQAYYWLHDIEGYDDTSGPNPSDGWKPLLPGFQMPD